MRAWVFGKNINTDLITPGRYNMSMSADALAKICFVEYRPEFASSVKKGDFVVGAENFGCGSSRETAVMALKACGVRAILAKSFARIFYRNCMNQGLLAIEMDTGGIAEGDALVLDELEGQVRNNMKNEAYGVEIPKAMLMLEKEG
ncbi:MAG: 3-isopropylmalate dehydratase, partial [Candidatus Micrarchaeia archaeon]